MEQFGKGLVLEPFLPTVVLGGGMIAAAGSKAQKEALLPPMIEGKKQFAFAWLERQSRYNLADVVAQGHQGRRRLVALAATRAWSTTRRPPTHIIVLARTAGVGARGEGADALPRRCQGQGHHAPRLPDPGCAARVGAHLRQGLGRRRRGAGQGRRRLPGGRGRGRPRHRGAVRRGHRLHGRDQRGDARNTSRRASSSACRSASSRCCSTAWSTASPTPRKRAR